eukprot:TRINITY_DN3135_c0_g1_i1.p2 TRINITY_DN3135_c0_g1~~TRINITY_DN3135_c0_g1_i1.p2  ORF type:complete len:324 (+),score=37.88 TRINITY_DN3135_c0_g1_i1:89-1060(+)
MDDGFGLFDSWIALLFLAGGVFLGLRWVWRLLCAKSCLHKAEARIDELKKRQDELSLAQQELAARLVKEIETTDGLRRQLKQQESALGAMHEQKMFVNWLRRAIAEALLDPTPFADAVGQLAACFPALNLQARHTEARRACGEDDLKVAVYMYTQHGPTDEDSCYMQLNRRLNCNDKGQRTPFTVLPLIPFITWVMRGMKEYGEPYKGTEPIYRGQAVSEEQWKEMHHKFVEEKEATWWGFLSGSTSKEQAEAYIRANLTPQKTMGIMFKTQNPTNAYDISKLSMFPNEQEVLMFPATSAHCVSVSGPNNGWVEIEMDGNPAV